MADKKTIQDVLNEINHKYGDGSIMIMDKSNSDRIKIKSMPSGCLSLDRVFGCGGMPRGRMIEVFGQESSGKSTLAMFIAANVQKSGGKVVWIDAEYSFSKDYAEKVGVDVSKLIISQPTTGEEGLDTVAKMASTGEIDLIVLDSVAALIPETELGKELNQETMALAARMMSKAMRMLAGHLAKTNTAVIFINQIREKVGVFFGNKNVTPGGKALKFFASVRLEVKKGENIKVGNDVVGNWMKVVGVKNKVGLPFREAEFELYYASGVDQEGNIFDEAVKNGIIEKVGNTYSYNEIKLGVGREGSKKYLKDNNKITKEIEKILIKSINNQ